MGMKLRCSNHVLTHKKNLCHEHRLLVPHASQAATSHPPEQGPQGNLTQERGLPWPSSMLEKKPKAQPSEEGSLPRKGRASHAPHPKGVCE